MKSLFSFILSFVLLLTSIITAQTFQSQLQSNYQLENVNPSTNEFLGIIKWGMKETIFPDSIVKHGGKYSMRIEVPSRITEKDFSCGVFRIPAISEGKKIELRGYMKMENVETGSAGLFMRIDNKSGTDRMDNMLNRGLKGTNDWQKFSIKLLLDDSDTFIYFGAILEGNGTIWADDFEILVDDKPLFEAKKKSRLTYKAELDTTFKNGSNILLTGVETLKTDDLTLLGKIWGFLKYYHPAVAIGNYNWDYELFRVMPKILTAISKEERNKIFYEWINSLGPISKEKSIADADLGEIKLFTDLDWIENETELGKELVTKLSEVKVTKREHKNYYLKFTEGVGNPSFENEEAYSHLPNPDTGFRLLALYRFWNIIEYLFPYKHLIKDDWNNVLHNTISEFINCSNALDYRVALLRVITKINDTHANIWSPEKILINYTGSMIVPCRISFIENKAVVVETNSNFGTEMPFKVGDVIEKINGISVDEIIKNKLPIYSASNYPRKLYGIARDLFRTNEKSLSVTFTRNGETKDANAGCVEQAKYFPNENTADKKSWSIIENNIGYIYPGKIKNSELPDMMKSLGKCPGIIIDLRCYPSEFIVFSLSEYLMPFPTQFVKFTLTNYEYPGMFSYTKPIAVGKEREDYYKGKIVIIVNESTISQAEYTTMAFRKTPGAIVLGSSTAGADGNVSPFFLPGGVRTMISGIGVYYPDGTETQGIGIVPDIEVKPTIKGIVDGKDELLNEAIQIIRNKK